MCVCKLYAIFLLDDKCMPYLSLFQLCHVMIMSLVKRLDAPLSLLRPRPQIRKGPHLSRYRMPPDRDIEFIIELIPDQGLSIRSLRGWDPKN
uniref:Predicted protein n=1 Tax=Hordeum vulgare subsp. vulgare TaxID=112509 RepID=F2D136_HORVV|nr:predicted protein [Hordeum vulgare subsp. vulgare]